MERTYVAWSLHTGPQNFSPIEKNSSWICGNWNGIKDPKKDIEERVKLLVEAFTTSRKELKKQQILKSTNVFLIPEFYFHSNRGPYPRRIKLDEKNCCESFDYISKTLLKAFQELEIKGKESWIICCGSALTCNINDIDKFLDGEEVKERLEKLNKCINEDETEANKIKSEKKEKFPIISKFVRGFNHGLKDVSNDKTQVLPSSIDILMNQYRQDPLCIVRNRGVLLKVNFNEGKINDVLSWGYEKQALSTVDLTMGIENNHKLETGGQITEWLGGYPSISTINGDKNTMKGINDNLTSSGARITIPNEKKTLQIGVEICLDHRLQRLRRTVKMKNNFPLDIQLIPAGGMQILDYSVAAKEKGVIFNCCGCDPIIDPYGSTGKQVIQNTGKRIGLITGVFTQSNQLMKKVNDQEYYSHSQIAFRADDDMEGYCNVKGYFNKKGKTFDSKTKVNQNLEEFENFNVNLENLDSKSIFPAGAGELNVYFKKRKE